MSRGYARDRNQAYELEPGEYDRRLAAQGGQCALCRQPPTDGGRRLVVDHDHATGRVRGLLCNGCNLFLGLAEAYLAEGGAARDEGLWRDGVWYRPIRDEEHGFHGFFSRERGWWR